MSNTRLYTALVLFALVSSILMGWMAKDAQANKQYDRWEYKSVGPWDNHNALGKQGWELVSVDQQTFHFKRKVN